MEDTVNDYTNDGSEFDGVFNRWSEDNAELFENLFYQLSNSGEYPSDASVIREIYESKQLPSYITIQKMTDKIIDIKKRNSPIITQKTTLDTTPIIPVINNNTINSCNETITKTTNEFEWTENQVILLCNMYDELVDYHIDITDLQVSELIYKSNQFPNSITTEIILTKIQLIKKILEDNENIESTEISSSTYPDSNTTTIPSSTTAAAAAASTTGILLGDYKDNYRDNEKENAVLLDLYNQLNIASNNKHDMDIAREIYDSRQLPPSFSINRIFKRLSVLLPKATAKINAEKALKKINAQSNTTDITSIASSNYTTSTTSSSTPERGCVLNAYQTDFIWNLYTELNKTERYKSIEEIAIEIFNLKELPYSISYCQIKRKILNLIAVHKKKNNGSTEYDFKGKQRVGKTGGIKRGNYNPISWDMKKKPIVNPCFASILTRVTSTTNLPSTNGTPNSNNSIENSGSTPILTRTSETRNFLSTNSNGIPNHHTNEGND